MDSKINNKNVVNVQGVSEEMDSPIFIVGMNGSGTTMLADCLGKHPGIYMLPHETYVIPYYMQNNNKYGDLSELSSRKKLVNELAAHKAYWAVNNHERIEVPDEFLLENGLAGVISGLYRYFAAKNGNKVRWGDKTPMYVQHMTSIAELFPSAQFIHIYRDGREIAQSLNRRWNLDPRRSIYRWRKTLQIAREQAKQLGQVRYMEVSFESLTKTPEQELKKICEFLRVDFDNAVMQSSMPHMNAALLQDNKNQLIENNNKWKQYFSENTVAQLELIAGKTLNELGYVTRNPEGEVEPSRLKQSYWLMHDKLSAMHVQYKKHGKGFLKVFFRRAKDAFIQLRTNQY